MSVLYWIILHPIFTKLLRSLSFVLKYPSGYQRSIKGMTVNEDNIVSRNFAFGKKMCLTWMEPMRSML